MHHWSTFNDDNLQIICFTYFFFFCYKIHSSSRDCFRSIKSLNSIWRPNTRASWRRSRSWAWAVRCRRSCRARNGRGTGHRRARGRIYRRRRRCSNSPGCPWWSTGSHRSSCTPGTRAWNGTTTTRRCRRSGRRRAASTTSAHRRPETDIFIDFELQ